MDNTYEIPSWALARLIEAKVPNRILWPAKRCPGRPCSSGCDHVQYLNTKEVTQ
jgi:hypothetical protein